ncbi:MAG: hypothetical protein HYY78_01875 [Betaproteobacteria bacterium]|nr:hypothetical protein [Betaproteobacteria bacterium]
MTTRKPDGPPAHLSDESKRLYKRLVLEFVLDDSAALMLLQAALEARDRLQEAREILSRDGCMTTDRWGKPRPHPALTMERDARAGMLNALRLLRLAPGSVD